MRKLHARSNGVRVGVVDSRRMKRTIADTMNRIVVATKNAPAAIGPYRFPLAPLPKYLIWLWFSQAIKANGQLFVSGCIGLDAEVVFKQHMCGNKLTIYRLATLHLKMLKDKQRRYILPLTNFPLICYTTYSVSHPLFYSSTPPIPPSNPLR